MTRSRTILIVMLSAFVGFGGVAARIVAITGRWDVALAVGALGVLAGYGAGAWIWRRILDPSRC